MRCWRFRILLPGWGVVIEPFFWSAVQTGLRVSELIGLNCQDVVLGTGAHVRCLGKGQKTTLHATPSGNGKGARCLAARTPRSAR